MPETKQYEVQDLPERFRSKVSVSPKGCWLWTASLIGGGYGQYHEFRDGQNRSLYAHRVAYEYLVGPIPAGLELDHTCRVRHCVLPGHLEAVTHRVNVLRGTALSAARARLTHCPQGHEYSGDNVIRSKRNERLCRACRVEYGKRWRAAHPGYRGKVAA